MIILESMIKVNSVIYLAIPYKLDYLQNMYGFTFLNAQTYNPIEKDITIPSFKYLVIEI